MGITVPDVNRRGFLGAIGKAALIGSAALLTPKVLHAHGSSWWHGLSQMSRNQAIVDATAPWMGGYGGSCKDWARTVVQTASKYHVAIPSTKAAPDDYRWEYDPNRNVITDSMCRLLENAPTGWIVQMKLRSGMPHTAIIAGKMSQSVLFVDSNWDLDGRVQTHLMSYSDFYNKLWRTWSYTLYYVV